MYTHTHTHYIVYMHHAKVRMPTLTKKLNEPSIRIHTCTDTYTLLQGL